jgi:hypothetical protein
MNREKEEFYRILGEKSERKRLLGGSRHRWEENIKMALSVIGWCGMD